MDTFTLNRRLPVRLDWWRKLAKCLDADPQTARSLCTKLDDYSQSHRLASSGLLTPELRLQLIRDFPTLRLQLIGPQTHERLLIGLHSEAQIYDACEEIVRANDGSTFVTPFVPQLLAIRGAYLKNNEIWQSASAGQFATQNYGFRTHFSSAKTPFCDSVFVLFWRGPEKHAICFEGTVNPNSIWSAGTAHLCDGQYTFRLGKHRTYSRAHIDGVLSACPNWPDEWIYESDDEHVRYIALEGTSPVTVVRSHGDSLDIDETDLDRAENQIASFDPTFTDCNRIKINIHTCPLDCASSLGCQNIRLDQYREFIQTIFQLESASKAQFGYAFETWYTLVDASKVC